MPLTDSHTISCPYCSSAVPVPDQYREWRREKERELAADAELFSLHKSLGKNPTVTQKAVVQATESRCCSGCLLYMLTGLFGAQLLNIMLVSLELAHKKFAPSLNLLEVPGGAALLAAVIILPYVLVLGFAAKSLFGLRKRTKTLLFLQSNLVAAPPVHEGGQASCRNCGASLDVQEGKVTATCYYCRSHNLVALEASWVKRLRQNTEKTSLTLRQALAIFDEEQSEGKGCTLGCTAALVLFGLFLFLSLNNEKHYEPPKEYPKPQKPQVVFEADMLYKDAQKTNRLHFAVDTKKKKFRTQHGDLIILGSLGKKKHYQFLDPKSKRYFEYSDSQLSELTKKYGHKVEWRLINAWRALEGHPSSQIQSLFSNPCELATHQGRHGKCTCKEVGPSLQEWSHTVKGKKRSLKHLYRTDLGITVSGAFVPTLENIQVIPEPKQGLFELPSDYQNAFSDKILADDFFDFLGERNMIPGFKMTRFLQVSDSPSPPAKALWTYQKEKWTKKNTQAQCVFIRRAYCRIAWDPKNPPATYDPYFIKLKDWDKKAEVGDYSYRNGEDHIVFAKGQNLFSVSYTYLDTKYPIVEVAKKVLKNAEKRGKPAEN